MPPAAHRLPHGCTVWVHWIRALLQAAAPSLPFRHSPRVVSWAKTHVDGRARPDWPAFIAEQYSLNTPAAPRRTPQMCAWRTVWPRASSEALARVGNMKLSRKKPAQEAGGRAGGRRGRECVWTFGFLDHWNFGPLPKVWAGFGGLCGQGGAVADC